MITVDVEVANPGELKVARYGRGNGLVLRAQSTGLAQAATIWVLGRETVVALAKELEWQLSQWPSREAEDS